MPLAQSRTTVFGAHRKAVAAIDQSYGDPEFASALREGSLTLMKRFASLALPDALYAAAANTEDEDAEALCPTEFAAVSASAIAVALAATNFAAATAAETAAVGALAMAIATCPEGGLPCLALPPLEAASALATANLVTATGLLGAATAAGVAAAANLADCLWAKRPAWIPATTSGGGGGGGEGSGDGGGGGGGGGGYSTCEFYVYVDYFGNILDVDDPYGCLEYAE